MRQILQNLKTGATELAEVPCPAVARGEILIRTTRSLISPGTERMLVEFGRAGLISKARQQPEKVRQVLQKAKTDGVLATARTVRGKLDQPMSLGYCNVGRVVETGAGAAGFEVGERVASNGHHAEMVAVPANLCARVPDGVSDDEAAFTVLGAIALQGLRLAAPAIGETFVVSGLGLIGLLAVQMLRANGCHVLALDFSDARLALAERFGAETFDLSSGGDPISWAVGRTGGAGVDGVLVTASTKSDEPMHQAAQMCRKRGRIILVGVTGLSLSRADFYEKELTFQVSCSYGPGRYETNYEQRGLDYPIGFVRWTEQRNFEAVLTLLERRALDVAPLITHRYAIDDGARAYDLISSEEPSLGVLMEYPDDGPSDGDLRRSAVTVNPSTAEDGALPFIHRPRLAFIGSGNYATGVLIPAFAGTDAKLQLIASMKGVSGLHAARKFGFAGTTTDLEDIFGSDAVDAVVVATRHDSHADLVVRALEAGKSVFVEKPLTLDLEGVDRIATAHDKVAAGEGKPLVAVGFNRRFAPLVIQARNLLVGLPAPKAMVMTVNAGAIPSDHWTQDPEVGGGRIIGEACHFIDLLRHFAAAPISGASIRAMDAGISDTVTIDLGFEDGSIGTIHYFANGHKAHPKERLEIFCGGKVLVLDNFRRLAAHGFGRGAGRRLLRQDKGQRNCAKAFVDALRGRGDPPIPFEELIEVSRVAVELAERLRR